MRWAASDVSPSSHLAFHILNTCRFFVLCCVLGVWGFVALSCFCFLFCKCFRIPNSPRSLDLDDRQGLIASSAMQQQKKNTTLSPSSSSYYHPPLPTLPLAFHSGPACHCGRSRHLILSRYISHTSFLALPPTNINLQAYSTSPPSYRPGLPLWLVSPFPITYSFSPLYPHTSSSPIVTWPGLSLW